MTSIHRFQDFREVPRDVFAAEFYDQRPTADAVHMPPTDPAARTSGGRTTAGHGSDDAITGRRFNGEWTQYCAPGRPQRTISGGGVSQHPAVIAAGERARRLRTADAMTAYAGSMAFVCLR